MTEKITAALCLSGTLSVLGLAGFFTLQKIGVANILAVLTDPVSILVLYGAVFFGMAVAIVAALGVVSNGFKENLFG